MTSEGTASLARMCTQRTHTHTSMSKFNSRFWSSPVHATISSSFVVVVVVVYLHVTISSLFFYPALFTSQFHHVLIPLWSPYNFIAVLIPPWLRHNFITFLISPWARHNCIPISLVDWFFFLSLSVSHHRQMFYSVKRDCLHLTHLRPSASPPPFFF